MTRVFGRLALILMASFAASCAARGAVPRPFPGAPAPPTASDAPAVEAVEAPDYVQGESASTGELLATALSLRGAPYRNGGADPSGFDCSGFVQYVFAQTGVALPRAVRDQYGAGNAVSLHDLKPGDLVFFETVSHGASHVGVVVEGDQFIHAPSSRGVVRIERFSSPYWSARYVGARRVGLETEASLVSGP